MRTIWKGSISFGLVNIPIRLVTATNKNNTRFRLLHQDCNTPVSTVRHCAKCNKDLEYDELVKGYEYEDNKFVILRDEDFDNIPIKSTKTIDIVDFVRLEEIDPIYYIKTYYLSPAPGGEKPYFLLKKSMGETNKVAVSKITLRNKESLALIRVINDVLALETMYFSDEVKSTEEMGMENLVNKITINYKEEKLAVDIINNLTAEFKPEKYDDEYREALLNIIRNKIEGQEVEIPEEVNNENKVLDLMEKLRASVEASAKGTEKITKKKNRKKTG